MSPQDILLITFAGFAAGVLNAIAGGGTIFTYSALLAAGAAPVSANATSATAVFLGSVASTIADRKRFTPTAGRLRHLSVASVVGGGLGAGLTLRTGVRLFASLVPWLILLATGVYCLSARLKSLLAVDRAAQDGNDHSGNEQPLWIALALQGLIATYGGYFSAGMGVMMLASLSLTEGGDYSTVNAAKNLLSIILQSAAVAIFLLSGAVDIGWLAPAASACVAGGWIGVVATRSIPEALIRLVVITSALGLATWLLLARAHVS